ncbi:GldG family protein [Yeguia hominis]|uniref:GldG family protein n=1 Tax=Yeguia hominis TaxID=2763662 RepID=A0A926DA15_9FIRM|nr:GldG family protein [Yeguia hominis]MBC8534011.1 GldG family protein [Yeguia hominis]
MSEKNKNLIPSEEEIPAAAAETPETDAAQTAAAEEPQESKTEKKAEKSKKHTGNFFKSTRFKRGGLATAASIGFIVIVVLLNVVFSILETRFPSMQIDMTTNKIFSLSDDALEAAEKVDIPTTIYILAGEEAAKNDTLLSSYGLQYSQVSVLAEKMQEANSNITVKYVDLDLNPTFASDSKYANYTLTTGSVLVENERRIRVLGITDLYSYTQDQTTGAATYYMQVDSALASALMQVTAENVPVVSIAAGSHSEMLANGLSSFKTLMENNQFEIKTFDPMTEEVPEDTQIVMLPTPSTDYTAEELAKLDAFLDDNTEGNRSLWVTFHPSQIDLPNLSAFLEEWGLEVPTEVIRESDKNNMIAADSTFFISSLTDEVDLGGEDSYKYFVTPQSRPVNTIFKSNNSVVTYALATSSDTSYIQDATSEEDISETATKQSYNTAALATKQVKVNGEYYHKSVVAFGSSMMMLDSYLSSNTFGNAVYLVDLARYTTGTTDSSIGVYTNKVETTTLDVTVPTSTRLFLGIGVFTLLIPIAILVAGVVVFLKRRHL